MDGFVRCKNTPGQTHRQIENCQKLPRRKLQTSCDVSAYMFCIELQRLLTTNLEMEMKFVTERANKAVKKIFPEAPPEKKTKLKINQAVVLLEAHYSSI